MHRLAPLPVPGDPDAAGSRSLDDVPAVRLLLDRARSVLPEFTITPTNRTAVVALCRRLDGLPLAIELAAVRLRTLPVSQVVERLGGRLHLLKAPVHDTEPRHHSLHALIDWSYDLCGDDERLLWERMSVFPASVDLETVDGVCGYGELAGDRLLDALDALVGKSVVVADRDGSDGGVRALSAVRAPARVRRRAARALRADRGGPTAPPRPLHPPRGGHDRAVVRPGPGPGPRPAPGRPPQPHRCARVLRGHPRRGRGRGPSRRPPALPLDRRRLPDLRATLARAPAARTSRRAANSGARHCGSSRGSRSSRATGPRRGPGSPGEPDAHARGDPRSRAMPHTGRRCCTSSRATSRTPSAATGERPRCTAAWASRGPSSRPPSSSPWRRPTRAGRPTPSPPRPTWSPARPPPASSGTADTVGGSRPSATCTLVSSSSRARRSWPRCRSSVTSATGSAPR